MAFKYQANFKALQLYFLCAVMVFITTSTAYTQRVKYSFNSDWKVATGEFKGAEAAAYNDAGWKKVTLPYAWNEDDAFKKDIRDLSTGIAWYRKQFRLPIAQKGSKVFVEFEGVRQAGEFYINGHYLGIHENGITAAGFDISDWVKFGNGENTIAVKTNNDWEYREKATNSKYQWSDKNFNANYGGIPKNVLLHVTGKIYQTLPLFSTLGTTGTYIYARKFDIPKKTAEIVVSSEVKNETTLPQSVSYEVRIKAPGGKIIATFASKAATVAPGETTTLSAAGLVKGLNFWSWGYGYLYDVETILKNKTNIIDRVITTTGFRKTAFKDGMIFLNDRVLQVHGYAQRTSNEWPAIGMSVPAWMSDYSNGLMVESNGNLVRWMHIAPWKQDIESCDRVGLLQAMPAGDAERDVEGVRWEQRKAVMTDAIIYNRNNPSIVFYEGGNTTISEKHMQEMKNIRDQYDLHGGRAIGSREMLNSKVAEYGGEMLYTNKSAGIPLWAMEYSRDEGARIYWDEFSPPYHKDGDGPLYNNQDARVYNRNQESHALENVARWYEFYKERPGTGKRVSSGGVNIIFSESNTHHRGENNYRRSGEVDALRIPKENFYANQVIWDGWVDVEKPRIHIVGHWNYAPEVVKDIFVISSADKVELLVNGRSMGNGTKSDGFVFTFKNIQYNAGTISAIGYDARGKQLCSTKKITAGKPHAIRLTKTTHPNGLMADGHDLALVQFEIVDVNGNRCPIALNLVNFKLQGNASWRGGMAQGKDNYILATSLPAEAGVNRVLIRSTTTPGNISLTAAADGLQPATLTMASLPFPVKDGLSARLPAEGLAGNLQRGPTPSTPSFTVSRKPLAIAKVTAGANADSAFKSYDDNERTDWYNDGKLSTAWIEYELAAPATIDEVALKLNNFRSRTYPLRITVDGKEVFADSTKRTLGYYTIVCKPMKGKKVRITLVQPAANKEGNTMVEMSGKKLDDGVARDDVNARGRLSIIEAEMYERVK